MKKDLYDLLSTLVSNVENNVQYAKLRTQTSLIKRHLEASEFHPQEIEAEESANTDSDEVEGEI